MTGTNPIDTDTHLDSRDIQERIDFLESLEDAAAFAEEDKEELAKLRQFKEDVSDSEWDYGIDFIQEDYFEDYAQELAEDLGDISKDMHWPLNHIDWEAAANELKIDYSSADFDGTTYLYRMS